jgi:two-component system KDP operon response regulator KdpE
MILGQVLLVDDEPGIITSLRPALKAAGHTVKIARDGAEAIASAELDDNDIVLLDLGLPDMDGKDVIRRIRDSTTAPIIVISARHQESEKIAALDVGADDYIDKPFALGELLARIRVALRRHERQIARPTTFDSSELAIDFASREVRLRGELLKVSPKEYNLLVTLAESAGQVVTQRRLLAAGWGRSDTDAQYLRTYIGLLRQKVELNPSDPQIIQTEPGVGYRLVLRE